MTTQQLFKEELEETLKNKLVNMDWEKFENVVFNNEERFEKLWDEENEFYNYFLKENLDLEDLITISKDYFEAEGKPYAIIDYVDDELIFEGYENLRHGDYLKRKRELNILDSSQKQKICNECNFDNFDKKSEKENNYDDDLELEL
ncbi:hypothetical protein [Mycoplasma sp. 125]|uniref:hypothetical protein n=1 Tax=Mycoplasma sp. 125 TaxID=3447505 RepID=UPI003F65C129